MKHFVIEEIVRPASRRVGTAVATGLIAYNIDAELAQQIAVGVSAVFMIAADLAASYLNRR
jgi:hypothetical protein